MDILSNRVTPHDSTWLKKSKNLVQTLFSASELLAPITFKKVEIQEIEQWQGEGDTATPQKINQSSLTEVLERG